MSLFWFKIYEKTSWDKHFVFVIISFFNASQMKFPFFAINTNLCCITIKPTLLLLHFFNILWVFSCLSTMLNQLVKEKSATVAFMSSPRMLIHSVIQYQILIDYTQRKRSTKTHKYMHFYSRYLNKNICDSIELFKIYVNELFLLWLCWICHGFSVPVRRNNPWIDFLIIDC